MAWWLLVSYAAGSICAYLAGIARANSKWCEYMASFWGQLGHTDLLSSDAILRTVFTHLDKDASPVGRSRH
jgi:hypothetical protein